MWKFKNYKWDDGPWLIADGSPESSITICWTTSQKKNSTLLWGRSKLNLCNLEESGVGGFHSVTLKNLSADTKYYYSVRENLTLFKKETIFSFKTQCKSDSDKPVEFIIVGDLQPKNNYTMHTNQIMANQIDLENPDFIVQTGDLVQIGSLSGYWHMLMHSFPLMTSSRPVFPVIGNHEYYFFHKNKNFKSLFPFDFPGRKSSYYSKDIGPLHITFLDPYDGGFAGMNSRISKEQKEWFVKDLKKAVNNGARWIFVVLHQAVLTNGEYSGDVKLQKWIFPLLSKFNIDAVFWGHAHLYEHWRYQYGVNGFVINQEDNFCKDPIDFFCIGSSGASLESHFRLFTHKPFKHKKLKWFNKKNGIKENKITIQYPWNREVFFEGKMGKDQFAEDDYHYYHLPFDKKENYSESFRVSYNTENEWFGYMYGENTCHYAKVRIENDICTISIHYADGSLLSGPDGSLPQIFSYERKARDIVV